MPKLDSDVLVINDLVVDRGAVFELQIASLKLKGGEILGVVGNNGAGKTTLLLSILEFLDREKGELRLFDKTWNEDEIFIKRNLGAYLDTSFLIDYMQVEEYYSFIASVYGLDMIATKTRISEFLDSLPIEFLSKQLIRELSAGNFTKVGLIGSLIHKPKLILWDEPFANLDPYSKNRLMELVLEVKAEENTSFIISSHNIEEIYSIADRFLVLDKGRTLAAEAKDVLSRDDINNLLGLKRKEYLSTTSLNLTKKL